MLRTSGASSRATRSAHCWVIGSGSITAAAPSQVSRHRPSPEVPLSWLAVAMAGCSSAAHTRVCCLRACACACAYVCVSVYVYLRACVVRVRVRCVCVCACAAAAVASCRPPRCDAGQHSVVQNAARHGQGGGLPLRRDAHGLQVDGQPRAAGRLFALWCRVVCVCFGVVLCCVCLWVVLCACACRLVFGCAFRRESGSASCRRHGWQPAGGASNCSPSAPPHPTPAGRPATGVLVASLWSLDVVVSPVLHLSLSRWLSLSLSLSLARSRSRSRTFCLALALALSLCLSAALSLPLVSQLEESDGARILFAYEEAIGFCLGDLVRDKDGIAAAVRTHDNIALAVCAWTDGRSVGWRWPGWVD